MGFFFRKGIKFGPFRVNLSKSGIGASVGVKGARISTGPRGTHLNVGRGGFGYRKRLHSKAPGRAVDDSASDVNTACLGCVGTGCLFSLSLYLIALLASLSGKQWIALLIIAAIVIAIIGAYYYVRRSRFRVNGVQSARIEPFTPATPMTAAERAAAAAAYRENERARREAAHTKQREEEQQRRRQEEARRRAEHERRRAELTARFRDPAVVERILQRVICLGDPEAIVVECFGFPAKRDLEVLKTKTKEVWKYRELRRNQYAFRVMFENGYVSGWAGADLPPSMRGQHASSWTSATEDTPPGSEPIPRSPYEVLGVAPGASLDEINAAYRKAAAENHPDKVSHLATEIREFAENRMKEINQAYEELKRRSR